MNDLKAMDLEEKVNWVSGSLIIAIGGGHFRSAIAGIIMAIETNAFERGREAERAVNARRRKRS